MSDLRTRIATAIQAKWLDLTLTDTWDENCLALADAVIEELKIKEVEAQSWVTLDDGHPKPARKIRFVTNWVLEGSRDE